jgi:hypothetical protein
MKKFVLHHLSHAMNLHEGVTVTPVKIRFNSLVKGNLIRFGINQVKLSQPSLQNRLRDGIKQTQGYELGDCSPIEVRQIPAAVPASVTKLLSMRTFYKRHSEVGHCRLHYWERGRPRPH